jgi:probable HAF family extracellular repeat protein
MRSVMVGSSVLLLACFGAAVATAPAANYAITDLGLGCATGINNVGQVVGCAGTYTGFPNAWNPTWASGGFLYSGGTRTDLAGTLTAAAINASGQVTGIFGNQPDSNPDVYVYSNATFTDLGGRWYRYQNAQSINASGQIAGYVRDPEDNPNMWEKEFIMDVNNPWSYIDFGNGSAPGTAWGINDAGQVTGRMDGYDAVLYSGGTLMYLSDLDGSYHGYVEGRAINNSTQIVGYSYSPTGDGAYHGFRLTLGTQNPDGSYRNDGTTVDFGLVNGGDTCASAINSSGQVVGESFDAIGTFATSHAFFYDGSTTVDLNSLISQSSGWTLTTALGINDSGQIVGGGIASDGQMHAFLLTPGPAQNPGDANGDNKVDINDLTIVLANYNQSGAWATGDFNGDTKVDINDLTIVLANYNQTFGATGIHAVPEPSMLAMFAAGMVGLLAYAWRKHK